uniref:pre-rRNA processing protein FTSJ3 n=1 Tax=Scleropages formosus TaxID=113540 RepID=A0A8C9TMX1_SCLFO
MGKKLKVGKTRKDKFYHLAKETGYRSRSSFKLIQLNRKFQFYRKHGLFWICVLLLVVGVDLVPIKPIPNVVTLQEDITTEKCRQALRKELQTWKVDVVLNDGAPNVGANWQHDAFSQAHLTLMALKLACEFLTKGGSFITKVFRSKDYQPLLWIFQQFFKKVQATKPQASRNESAEIFVICQGYLAPDKIDNKFFDPKHAFKEVEVQVKTVKELVPVKKPKAEGYADDDLTLYHNFSVTEFLRAENPVDFLSKASEISFDNDELTCHPATTNEIKECCRDIRVLGRKELRLLLNWRGKLRRFLAKKLKEEAKQLDQEISLSSSEGESDTEQERKKKDSAEKVEGGDSDEEEMAKKLAELKAEEVAELRRKKKKLLRERRKQRERVELKMDLPGVSIADDPDASMFSLSKINKAKALCEISKGDMKVADDVLLEEEGGGDDVYLSDAESDQVSLASDLDAEDLEEIEKRQKQLKTKEVKKKVSFEEDEKDQDEQRNELLVELEGKEEKQNRETNMWFSKVCKRAQILDPEGLAIGSQIATSKKKQRDLIDGSFNRQDSEDPSEVPEWFLDDEKKHRRKPVPITREMVEEYKQRWREINARPIKRVAEAKARKKRRMLKKMEQAKKKAEAVVNTVDISEREKMAQLRSIYKKAGLGKEKRELTYVVAKKGVGRKVRRPAGVKGVFRVVDGRMKKDRRGQNRKEQREKGKGKKGGKGMKRGKGQTNKK